MVGYQLLEKRNAPLIGLRLIDLDHGQAIRIAVP
jgi:hypothetical protein